MTPVPVNFREKLSLIDDRWSPRVVAALNENVFKLAKIEGEFVWHSHEDTDEAFVVLEGSMEIEFPDGSVHLERGEMVVVPRGVEHRPVAHGECHVLLVEPRGVVNTGETGGDLTARTDVWI